MKNNQYKKIVLITRIKMISGEDNLKYFINWLNVFLKSDTIYKIFILSDQLSNDNLNLNDIKIEFITLTDPTSPISINYAIEKLSSEIDYFLITSKEVNIESNHINGLISEIEDNNKLLVVGYKFVIKDNKKLNNELQMYYNDSTTIAYRVPWNTCALWDLRLFKRYVKKFDEITSKNPFNQIEIKVDGINILTAFRGMEDGLAIAKAISNKISKLHFKLIKKNAPSWKIDKVQSHREKLARKDKVLRIFMIINGYSEHDLLKAEIK